MPRPHGRARRGYSLALAIALLGGLSAAAPPTTQAVVSTDVVVSQVYGGGGNSGAPLKNDFVELYNRGASPVSLTGWSVQYASATGTGNFGSNPIALLSGTIQPGRYYLVQLAGGSNGSPLPTPDSTGTANMSGTGGKVALVTSASGLACNGGSTPCSAAQLALIKDLVGWDGANFYEGAPAPSTASSTAPNTLAILRKDDGAQDTDNNAADFVAGAPNPRNSAYPLVVVGTATPSRVFAGDPLLLTMAVTAAASGASPSVSCDLSSIGGPSAQGFFDDGTNGDATAGDGTFSFATSVATGTAWGPKSLACTVNDGLGHAVSTTIPLTVLEVVPIGTVNGAVLDTDNGATHASPYNGQVVTVQGVIYERTLQAISGTTDTYKGFYIQNTTTTADTDPNTSDGLFVFMNKNSTLAGPTGPYSPAVGDEIVISGSITEYYNMTELQNAAVLSVVQSGVDVDAQVVPVVATPPVSLDDANRYWERLQGMRVGVPAESVVLGGRNVFSPADAEIWLAAPNSTVAQRTDAYERRAFRDAHPLDDNYNPTSWDGNGYRILMGSLGIKAAAGDAQALIEPGRTFDTVTSAISGGLNYTYSKYRIEVSTQPTFAQGPDPAADNAPAVIDRSTQYSVVDYNLENLYDYRDNPFSGCDFNGGANAGCLMAGTPFLSDVKPSYDYVPASDAAYQARLTDIATQIIGDLHAPDILMVQEVENQDICTVTGGALTCGTTDNADGKPDVLQELALRISSLGGPAYDAAFDRDSSDLRGILPAYLYRTDRVVLATPAAGDTVLGESPAIPGYTAVPDNADVSNPKTLNAVLPAGVEACETSWVFPRAPSVALFRIYSESVGVGPATDVYAINNHFKSGPDTCVAHRTEQAKYDAALVAYIEQNVPGARIVLGGDLNVYPRPDDPFTPIGQPGSSDQLGSLYDQSLGLTNLWNVLLGQAPESAYSYVYLGMAQTLDQMFVNGPMLASLHQFRIAHINSDFPADYAGDVARGTSDHDPNVATFNLVMPFAGFFSPVEMPDTVNTAKAGQGIPLKFSIGGDRGLDIFASGPTVTPFACETSASVDTIETAVSAAVSSLHYDPLTGQYVYTWKTDKSWAGSCQKLSFVLIDGTVHEAWFEFTR